MDLADISKKLGREKIENLLPIENKRFFNKKEFLSKITSLDQELSKKEISIIKFHAKRFSFRKFIRLIAIFFGKYIPSSKIALSLTRSFLLRPTPFGVWFRIRMLSAWLKKKIMFKPFVESLSSENEFGLEHNYKQVLDFWPVHRARTEKLCSAFKSIHDININTSKILLVGPRNEGELLLFRGHGFKKSNIEAIDLFSYSSSIKLMDMNDLKFDDEQFDIYYNSYTFRYSTDINKSISESLRVTKNGGLIGIAAAFNKESVLSPKGSELEKGIESIVDLYGSYIDSIIWSEEYTPKDEVGRPIMSRGSDLPTSTEYHILNIIFRITK